MTGTTGTKPRSGPKVKRQAQATGRRAQFDARVAEWDSRIKAIEAKYEQARAGVSSEVSELLDVLRKSHAEARAQIDKLTASGDAAWERSRAAVEGAFDEVSAAYEAVRRRLR